MQAFLREDLWAKPYLHRAEQYTQTTERDSAIRVQTRITFLASALISSAQAICFVAVTAIALVGHVLFSVANLAVNFDFSRHVSTYFYDSFSKLRGSLMVAVIAALSALTSTELSLSATGWFGSQVSQNWDQFKVNEVNKLADRIDNLRLDRLGEGRDPRYSFVLNGQHGDEFFQLGRNYAYTNKSGQQFNSPFYFDAMTHDIKMKVRGLIAEADQRINDPNATPAQKFENTREAIDRISNFITKKNRKLNRLPVTYIDFVDDRLQKAERSKDRALRFLDREVASTGDLERRRYPGKFDEAKFYANAKAYRAEVAKGFDAAIENLRLKNQAFKATWKVTVVTAQQHIEKLQTQLKSYEWWLKWCGLFFSDETKQQYAKDMTELQKGIQQGYQARAAAVYNVRKGAFKSFEWQQLNFDGFFKKQVQAGGKILNAIQSYAKPSLERRLFRNLMEPILSWGPESVRKGFESVLDPDRAA